MKSMHYKDIIGFKVNRLLQTPPERGKVMIEAFGEPLCIELVVELEDGRLFSVWEYECTIFTGDKRTLQSAELVDDEYNLSDIEGHRIVDVLDNGVDFGLKLDNGLYLHCPCAPGGNFPSLFTDEGLEENEKADGSLFDDRKSG